LPKFRKTAQELEEELAEQVAALRTAAAGYDSGQSWNAKQLAAILYILLHEGTGRTKSLLGLVGLKAKARFISSMVVPPDIPGQVTMACETTLLMVRVAETKWVPAFADSPFASQYKWLPVSRWWDEVVFHPETGINLSRKNIVFLMRSQDGGAHVDSHRTNEDYDRFSRTGSALITLEEDTLWIGGGRGKPLPHAARALVRQLAWEADESLKALGL